MRKTTKSLFNYLLIFLTFLIFNTVSAQLDSEHYLPPLKQVSNNAAISQQSIYLSTPETTPFVVEVYRGTSGTPFLTIPALVNGTPYEIDATDGLTNGDNNITLVSNANTGTPLTNSGLRFVAPGGQSFYVNYRGRSNSQAGSLTCKGAAALGRDFRWGGIPNRANNSNLTTSLGIMAVDPGLTTINIFGYDPDCVFRDPTGAAAITDDALTITLNQYETFVLEAPKNSATANIEGWLGASITSDLRIALSLGGLNTGVNNTSQGRDTGIDQPVPTTAVGREYVFVRGNGGDEVEFPIIVATQNDTQVFAGGTLVGTINNGEFLEIPATFYSAGGAGANMYVNTSKESYAFQCLAGQGGRQTLGMNFIAPVNCLLPDVLNEVATIDQIAGLGTGQSALTIIASTTTPDANITVTDSGGVVALPASTPVTGTADWKTFFVDGLIGEVDVTSTGPIAVGTFMAQGTNAGLAGYFSGFDTVPIVDLDVAGGGCFPGTTLSEITGGFDAYQWYQDGSPIPGATMSTYIPTTVGAYFVEVTKGTCTYSSAVLTVYNCDPDIVVTKTDDVDPILEGDNVTFTITVQSWGVDPVTNLVINDALPTGLSLVSATPSYGTWVDPNWTIGTMNAGEIHTLTIVAMASVGSEGTTVTNTVTNTQDQTDSNDTPDDMSENVTIEDGEIGMTKSSVLNDGGDGVQAGDTIDYTFVVSNNGILDLSNIVVNDPMLGGNIPGPASGDINADNILNVGEVWTYTSTYVITQDDIDNLGVTNSATVSGEQSNGTVQTDTSDDPNDSTDTDNNGDGEPDDPTDTTLPENPSMSLTKVGVINDGGDGLQAGDTIDYTFTVVNTGNVSLSNVVVNDPLLGGVVAGPASGDTDADTELDVTETWIYTASYTITQADIDAGVITNSATVVADSPGGTGASDTSDDPNDSTDTDNNGDGEPDDPTDTTLPQDSAISITKALLPASDGNYDTVGEVIMYEIIVTNTGNVTLMNVNITDANADPGSVTPSNIPVLLPGESVTVSAAHTITQADLDAGSVTNTAVATGEDPNGDIVSDESDDPNNPADVDNNGDGEPDDPTVTGIPQEFSISITKAADEPLDGSYDSIGEVITYTMIVTNTSTVTLSNIVISDPNADAGSITPSVIATLAPGESVTVTAEHTITQEDLLAGEVVNVATATGETPGGMVVGDESDDPNDPTDVDNNGDGEPDDPTVTDIGVADVTIYDGITPDGDGDNDQLIIGGIENFPNNTLRIYNRWGVLVYETRGYGQNNNFFRGISEGRVTVQQQNELPVGTYYYILEYKVDATGQVKNKAGYIYINR